jgi:N-formylglutamate amidohydrolase
MPDPGPEFAPPFEVLEPVTRRGAVVFNSPHSGRVYPPGFLASSRLDALTLRRSEDAYVDELFLGVVARGAPLMRAHFPRAFLDVNREPYELDPRMFSGRLPPYANTRSVRVAGGLGTIARIVSDSEEIYAGQIPVEEGMARIERYHQPYHQTLRGLLARVRRQAGAVLLVDCHSMPSSIKGLTDRTRADFVIGDRYGTSCHRPVVDVLQETLRRLGYAVLRNKPYAGGYITEQYGTPAMGFHSVQIEINRALYLDEAKCERSRGFSWLAGDLMRVAEALIALDLADAGSGAAAAE